MTVEKIISDLDAQLAHLKANHGNLELREKVLLLVEIIKSTRGLSKASVNESGITARGARERLKLYLIRYVGIQLDGLELEVVSGISEYARRVRELRVEDGYEIRVGPINDEETGFVLPSGKYLLTRAEPDLTAARRWLIANRIRKEEGSAQDRLLRYLQENVGVVVTTEELGYVAQISSFQRRVRELRTEEGYAVATMFTGRPDLRQGEYVLESLERTSLPHDRHIPKDVERAVYARDNNTCVVCGWSHARWMREDPRYLELHHIQYHREGGPNSELNLIVLCNKCHDDVHAERVDPPKPQG